ncbi:toll/interleukin-1 receptor domain-containing protein [Cryptosporangium arvum]|uniref:TIR domain-containing protein n=1 Tax=Cryptosporangium arvum DSM 44712 TaxID=927661 RepID=A0A010YGV2_9ACTN|nr:toll/interleukin-1 receptor domain-containing protein [Cryptosporangium arvum]EXG79500.1 hypothetical protein CryarDRAFT_0541 [Cryptosporangium arvum DSM 44712]
MDYYFFTSHSSSEDERGAVKRFHDDLERQLWVQAGLGVGGILDRYGLAPGWERSTTDRADWVPSMVALCSGDYFADPDCREEWVRFAGRVRKHTAERAPAEKCLITVRWRGSLPQRPEGVEPRYLNRAWWPPVHGPDDGSGLADFMRHRGQSKEYYAIVTDVVRQILEAKHIDLAADPSSTGPEPRSEPRESEVPVVRDNAVRSIAISYVGADQPWADWLRGVFREKGHQVDLFRWNAHHETSLKDSLDVAASRTDRVVVLLSRHYLINRSRQPQDWESALVDSAHPEKIVRVRLDSTPLPAELRTTSMITLEQPTAEVVDELVRAVESAPVGNR